MCPSIDGRASIASTLIRAAQVGMPGVMRHPGQLRLLQVGPELEILRPHACTANAIASESRSNGEQHYEPLHRLGSIPMLSDALMCWNTSSSSGFKFFILRGIGRDWPDSNRLPVGAA